MSEVSSITDLFDSHAEIAGWLALLTGLGITVYTVAVDYQHWYLGPVVLGLGLLSLGVIKRVEAGDYRVGTSDQETK